MLDERRFVCVCVCVKGVWCVCMFMPVGWMCTCGFVHNNINNNSWPLNNANLSVEPNLSPLAHTIHTKSVIIRTWPSVQISLQIHTKSVIIRTWPSVQISLQASPLSGTLRDCWNGTRLLLKWNETAEMVRDYCWNGTRLLKWNETTAGNLHRFWPRALRLQGLKNRASDKDAVKVDRGDGRKFLDQGYKYHHNHSN